MRATFLLLLATGAIFAQRQVAVAIDDLPLGGAPPHNCESQALTRLTRKLLRPLIASKTPVTGFVTGSTCQESFTEALTIWTAAGFELGNHTWSHQNLNTTPLDEFEADVVKGEESIRAATGRKPRYFRHPMLMTGGSPERRTAFEEFLTTRGYTIAPVTLDNSDWMFAVVYGNARVHGDAMLAKRVRDAYLPYMESIFSFFEKRSVEVTGREFPQVLLIHVSQLNADVMPELLGMMKNRGYRVVSLETALRDRVYSLPNTFSGPNGFSWLHRWSYTKGMPDRMEPSEPEWLVAKFRKMRNR